MFVGILLLTLGALMLLDKMGIIYGSLWDYILPVALIGFHSQEFSKTPLIWNPDRSTSIFQAAALAFSSVVPRPD